jgi:hypothetical protein
MKKLFIQGLIALGAVFLILFLGRWLFLYHEAQNQPIYVPTPGIAESGGEIDAQIRDFSYNNMDQDVSLLSGLGSFNRVGHNYAKESYFGAMAKASPPSSNPVQVQLKRPLKPMAQEETYEKIGSLASWTRDFEADSKSIRGTLDANKVLIQQEQNSGLKGNRLLQLALGVIPEKFDAVVESLRQVGHLVSFRVTKTSKTNDYKAQMAQRDSLEKDKADLMALKNQGGKMSERLQLQEKIFSIEKQIADLGLSIGQFEGTTSLCTVLVTLKEVGPAPALWVFAWSAFHWAVGIFFGSLFYLLFLALVVLVAAWAIEKTKALPDLLREKLMARVGKK